MLRKANGTRTTLDDIARAAGCSKNTVSLALRDSRRISQDLRRRVRALAEQLQYTTNFAARNLRARRSGMIGIFTRAFNDAPRMELAQHLLAELHTAEYRPVIGVGPGSGELWHASPWMQTFRELRVEALVVLWEEISDLPEWTQCIPVISVGASPRENLPCDYLALDRRQAGTMATEHLLARGYRRVLIGATESSEFAIGARKALAAARCRPCQPAFEINFVDLRQARLTGYNVARQKAPPDAAVFVDAGYAAHFLRGVLDAHRRVPKDIAVAGYDYFPWADMLAVPLTTVEQPITTMASAAVDLVRRRLAQPDGPPVHIVQPHTLNIRGSS